jgi:hypothetical protein
MQYTDKDTIDPIGGHKILKKLGIVCMLVGFAMPVYEMGMVYLSNSTTFNSLTSSAGSLFDGGEEKGDSKAVAPTPKKVQSQGATVTESDKSFLLNQKQLTTVEVRVIQISLAKDATLYPEGITSGEYGKLTHSALMRFQKKYGLDANGYFTLETRMKFNEVYGTNL